MGSGILNVEHFTRDKNVIMRSMSNQFNGSKTVSGWEGGGGDSRIEDLQLKSRKPPLNSFSTDSLSITFLLKYSFIV